MNAQVNAPMTENPQAAENRARRESRDFTWIVEVLLLVCVAPALVYGVTSLSNLPIA